MSENKTPLTGKQGYENHLVEVPFEIKDIEDAKIIIKAKGKHWAILPKDKDMGALAKEFRIAAASICLGSHVIVDKPLEDLK